MSITELPSSELGTKEYWDAQYVRELSNFKSRGDIGEVWFEDSVDGLMDWLLNTHLINTHSSLIDIGCGNGALLLNLAAENFTSLYGIDYSQKAIELAKAVAAQKKAEITYEVVDLLNCDGKGLAGREYDVCHDKGTYDAVSLSPDDPKDSRQRYMKAVHAMTRNDGLFVITSCNWTAEELEEHFAEYFVKEHIIPTPTFMFGGKVGSKVSSVVFRKRIR